MLVLSRKVGQSIIVGDNIEVSILEIGDGNIKIGVNAPKSIKIVRKELIAEIKDENIKAVNSSEDVMKLIK